MVKLLSALPEAEEASAKSGIDIIKPSKFHQSQSDDSKTYKQMISRAISRSRRMKNWLFYYKTLETISTWSYETLPK